MTYNELARRLGLPRSYTQLGSFTCKSLEQTEIIHDRVINILEFIYDKINTSYPERVYKTKARVTGSAA